MWRKTAVAAALSVSCSGPRGEDVAKVSSAASQGPWSLMSNVSPPQLSNHSATLLNDTKLVIVGGINALDIVQDRGFVFSFDLSKHTVDLKPGGKLVEARQAHTTTLLTNGRLLVAGGDAFEIRSTAELADPMSGTSGLTGTMRERRSKHAAARLADGKVLVAGGSNAALGGTSSSEIYDPAAGTWSDGPAMVNPRIFVTATTLKDGKILIVGGPQRSAELFDPATKTFIRVANMMDNRVGHVAALLPSGKVLVAGGYSELLGTSSASVTNSAEVFDPATKTWAKVPQMPTPRGNASAVVLKNGVVMVAGGRVELTPLNYVDFYDEKTNAWQSGTPMVLPHALHTATALSNGDVVVTGSAYGEIWTPLPVAKACGLSADCDSGFCVDGVCCATACAGLCERCDTGGARGTCTPVSGAFNHCAPGNTCIQNACVPSAGTTCAPDKLGTLDKDGAKKPCTPYICDNSVGMCVTQCTTSVECAPGSVCNTASKTCGPAPAGDEGGGCSASPGATGSWLALLLVAAACFRARRRA